MAYPIHDAVAKVSATANPNIRHALDLIADKIEPIEPPPPPTTAGEFPVGVYWQNHNLAAKYKLLGINRYLMTDDTTVSGLDLLKASGIKCFPDQARQAAGLSYGDQSVIAGWIQPDEPDNATHACPAGVAGDGGKCAENPAASVARYGQMKAADPLKRPIVLSLGRALGNPDAQDRGSYYHEMGWTPGDYYKGCDIACNDCYPVNNGNGEHGANGPLTEIADAVDKMRQYAPGKPCYQILECVQINTTQGTPSPLQTRCEAWLALIHGADGIAYFVHQWTPTRDYAAIFQSRYDQMRAQMTATHAQIQRLAGPIQTPNVNGAASVSASSRIDLCVRDFGGHRYLFAANPNNASVSATFTVQGAGSIAAVIDEGRSVAVSAGKLLDSFAPYAVHLYQVS